MQADVKTRLAQVRLLGLDVDGVFTDGRLYVSDDGSETKAFNTQDGFGIRRVLDAGIVVVVISGRRSEGVARRMRELGVEHVFLGIKDKVAVFEQLRSQLDIRLEETAYVGDDVPDLPLLKTAGLAIGVANAHAEIVGDCDWITTRAGGRGAVREVCDALLSAR